MGFFSHSPSYGEIQKEKERRFSQKEEGKRGDLKSTFNELNEYLTPKTERNKALAQCFLFRELLDEGYSLNVKYHGKRQCRWRHKPETYSIIRVSH